MNPTSLFRRFVPAILIAAVLALGLGVALAQTNSATKKKTTTKTPAKKPKPDTNYVIPRMPVINDATPPVVTQAPPPAPTTATIDITLPADNTPANPGDIKLGGIDNTPAPAAVPMDMPPPKPPASRTASTPPPMPVIASPAAPAAPAPIVSNEKWVFDVPDKTAPEVKWWRDSQADLNDRLGWFRDARFGMFIHWGVYSGLGNEFHGKRGGGYAEHIQRVLKIPISQYRTEVAGKFNPVNFNADDWVRLARDAGMKYIVITAKHHDGFAMWPSKVNDYNVMDATPWHHDPMADLKAACDKYGIKFGFYYSQAFDWGNQYAPGNDWDYQNPGGDKKLGGKDWWKTKPEFMASARKYVDEKAIPQLRELIGMYHPAILWFDTESKLPPSENLRIMKAVREADPNIVISGRLVIGWGDYTDTTDRPANFPPHDGDWEGIPTTDESYGWNPFDTSHKPPSHFIQLLAKASARGGNMLLNIGPMGDGRIDPKDVAILKGIGDWWRVNGESIRGTQRTPLPVQTWGETTVGTNPVSWKLSALQEPTDQRIYMHVFDWPTNGQLVVGGLKSDVLPQALLLSDINQALHGSGAVRNIRGLRVVRVNALDVDVVVPTQPPDPADSVVVLVNKGEIAADSRRLLQPQYPDDILRAFDGQLHGGLKFGPGKKTDDVVTDWNSSDESVSWAVRLAEPATYEVLVNYDQTNSVANTFTVNVGSKALSGETKANENQFVSLGTVSLPPGTFDISVVPRDIRSGELFRLRSLKLKSISK